MKRLRSRIIRLFGTGHYADADDDGKHQKLEYLVKTKEMVSIYCICIYATLCDYAIIFTGTKKHRRAIEQITTENTS